MRSVHNCGKASRAAENSKNMDHFANPIDYSVWRFDQLAKLTALAFGYCAAKKRKLFQTVNCR